MNNKNIKVIDDHNIDRNANIMFAIELEGSEYVVYSIERDTESNNVFVSKVLRDVDGTYNMLNIDETDKKEEVANIVKVLVSTAVANQNSKLNGTEMALSDGKMVKFVGVSFNKEQKISVQKTYITTVKKEVTNVAEKYYDVVSAPVVEVAPSVATPAPEPAAIFPSVTPVVPEPVAAPVVAPVVEPQVVAPTPEPVAVAPELPNIPAATIPVPEVVQPAVQAAPVVAPAPEPVVVTPVVETPAVTPIAVQPAAVVPESVVQPTVTPTVASVVAPVAEPTKVEPFAVQPTPVVPEPIPDAFSQPLVFNASKETNLNAALGEAADATNIPVESIQPVKEFGVDAPVVQPAVQAAPVVAPVAEPVVAQVDPKVLTKKAGFANSKFFMVVAVAFFLASCIFLGYEVFNYFQLIK